MVRNIALSTFDSATPVDYLHIYIHIELRTKTYHCCSAKRTGVFWRGRSMKKSKWIGDRVSGLGTRASKVVA